MDPNLQPQGAPVPPVTLPVTQSPSTPSEPEPSSPKKKMSPAVIAGMIGTFVILVAAGVAVYLLQNPKTVYDSSAAAADKQLCSGTSCADAETSNWCWVGTTKNECLYNGAPEGSTETFGGNGNWDGDICYRCDGNSDEEGASHCSTGSYVGGNADLCPGGGGTEPPGGGTSKPTSTPKPISAACRNIGVFKGTLQNYRKVTRDDIKNAKAGDKFLLMVGGNTSSGSFDQAQFWIQVNGEVLLNWANGDKVPFKDNTFYKQITITQSQVDKFSNQEVSFVVDARIHHTKLGWSN